MGLNTTTSNTTPTTAQEASAEGVKTDPATNNQNNDMWGTIIASTLSAAGGIFTSFKGVQLKRLELEELNAKAKLTDSEITQKRILASIDLKKTELENEAAATQAKAKQRGIIVIAVTALIGFLAYLKFKKPKGK